MTNTVELTFLSGDRRAAEPVLITDLIIGGWTGRDKAKLEEQQVVSALSLSLSLSLYLSIYIYLSLPCRSSARARDP